MMLRSIDLLWQSSRGKIPTWKLSDKQRKTLKDAAKSSRGGKKAALEMKTVFQIVGGDNATECEVNRTKSQLRRTNALGRGSPANAHVDQLSARRLLRLPGLLNVLNSSMPYRQRPEQSESCLGT